MSTDPTASIYREATGETFALKQTPEERRGLPDPPAQTKPEDSVCFVPGGFAVDQTETRDGTRPAPQYLTLEQAEAVIAAQIAALESELAGTESGREIRRLQAWIEANRQLLAEIAEVEVGKPIDLDERANEIAVPLLEQQGFNLSGEEAVSAEAPVRPAQLPDGTLIYHVEPGVRTIRGGG